MVDNAGVTYVIAIHVLCYNVTSPWAIYVLGNATALLVVDLGLGVQGVFCARGGGGVGFLCLFLSRGCFLLCF